MWHMVYPSDLGSDHLVSHKDYIIIFVHLSFYHSDSGETDETLVGQ